MSTINVNGFDMYYEKVGSGQAIAFIHGGYGGADSSVLPRGEEWVDAFKDAYSVITYDRRGAGRSDYPDTDYTLEGLASDLRGLLRSLGIDRSVVIGSSGGGPIALTYALAYPETVIGLVLPNTSARLWEYEARVPYAEIVQRRIQLLETQGAEAAFDLIQREQAGSNPLVLAPRGSGPRPPGRAQALEERSRRVQELVQSLDRTDRTRYAIGELRNQAAYLGSDLRPRLREIVVPTLIVHGDGDLQVPYTLGVELADGIPEAEMVTIAGAGHGIMQWEEAVKAIRGFCDHILSATES